MGEGARGFVALADIDIVDTESHLISLRPSAARERVRPVGPSRDCACPTDFVCASCGYGVAEGHLPRRCPMCGGHRWRPAHERGGRAPL